MRQARTTKRPTSILGRASRLTKGVGGIHPEVGGMRNFAGMDRDD